MLKKISLLIFLFLVANLSAQDPEKAPEFFGSESFQRAHIGIHIVDLKTQKEAVSYFKDQYFIPASLQKLIITASALSSLGLDYRFTTRLEYDGMVNAKGVLQGNLWLSGGGDPTLKTSVFSTWESALKQAGIAEVKGKVYADVSSFEIALASPHWEFGDLGNYYGAGASALTVNQSMYTVTFQPGAHVGAPATVLHIDPKIPFLIFENEVTTGPAGSGDKVSIYGSEYASTQFYRGTVPLDEPTFTVKAAMPDPALFCAMEFAEKIGARQGVEMLRTKDHEVPKCTTISIIESAPLQELIQEMNFASNNLYAEHLLKAIGKGSAEDGLSWVREFLKWQSIPAKVYDAAGIARKNMMTPKGLTTLLSNLHSSPHWNVFYASLPEGGKEGTLQSLTPLSQGVLRAKSGSMSGIYNLAGYITFPSGKEYAFAIFCNNYEGSLQEIRKEINRFLLAIEPTLAAL